MRSLPVVEMTQRGGEDDKRKNLPFVIPTERSDDCMDAGGKTTLEAKVEKSPNTANRLMRSLPVVEMTSRVVDSTREKVDMMR
jgi:hypothetical protein